MGLGGSVVVAGVLFKGLKSVPTGPATAAWAWKVQVKYKHSNI